MSNDVVELLSSLNDILQTLVDLNEGQELKISSKL
jgi:hypothetical protein